MSVCVLGLLHLHRWRRRQSRELFLCMASSTSNPAQPHTYRRISLRDPSSFRSQPIPENYEFLTGPCENRQYRVNFRHPGYPADENLLFTLFAWDDAEGGIHHGLAHNACAIFADNRFDGYLSRVGDTMEGDRIEADWDDVLPAGGVDYWFYVPRPGEEAPSDAHDQDTPTQTPYRWPLVPTFQDWRFPSQLPPTWTRCTRSQPSRRNVVAASSMTAAIRHRDVSCRVTAFGDGTEVAHMIPDHEREWFKSNNMFNWISDPELDPSNLLCDPGNAVLLRADIHAVFDQRKFIFFPKSADGFVVHMLKETSHLSPLYHNTPIQIPLCTPEFIFARFAWSIFPLLARFLLLSSKSRLVALSLRDGAERVIQDISDTSLLVRKVVASRSNSPTKRLRMAEDLVENEEMSDAVKRRRTIKPCHATLCATLLGSSPLAKEAAPELSRSFQHQSSSPHSELSTSPDSKAPTLDMLRKQALSRARPAGYVPRLPYDPHRPAKEELWLMGVEVLSSDDGLEDDDDNDNDNDDLNDIIEREYREGEMAGDAGYDHL